jgi:tetratricopeptide (TPR) repeat protein
MPGDFALTAPSDTYILAQGASLAASWRASRGAQWYWLSVFASYDYYDTLGVWDNREFRLDTLMNDTERAEYDRKLRPFLKAYQDPYRENLAKRMDDPAAQSRLILYNLLNDQPREAIDIYERMRKRDENFEVWQYLDQKDYLDCQFLMGEEYERQGNWKAALRFYENVYNAERNSPMRFFLEEVKDRIRDIYCKKVARRCRPIDSVKVYEKVMAMGVSKKTEAYLHKKIAESYFKGACEKKARFHLRRAFELEPKLKGAQKICEKLSVSRHSS